MTPPNSPPTPPPALPAPLAPSPTPDRARGLALLACAIATECTGTLMLQASRGFTQLAPSLGVLVGYGAAILLFSRALEHGLTLGIAYGTLTGCGLVAATVLSTLLFAEPLAAAQACGLALVLLGAVVLQLRPGSLRGGDRG